MNDKNTVGSDPGDFLGTLRRDRVIRHAGATLTPLTDGVSSEIFRVDDDGETFVVKRALPKLRVKDHWIADVSRNRYEQMYIAYVSRLLPEAVPRLRSGDANHGYFAMEWLGLEFTSWKKCLLRGEVLLDQAVRASEVLGKIHARSAGDPEVAKQFDSTANFIQLRIEPYLLTTGNRNPDLRPLFEAEARRLGSTHECLVHGDFSPKNIMVSRTRLVVLDCEVAWYGDPAFDVAFLLTHFLLKSLYHAPRQIGLDAMSQVFWQRYATETSFVFDPTALQERVARLLLMLLLARMDGKSPIEYLEDPRKVEWVRRFTRTRIPAGRFNLESVLSEWFTGLQKWGLWP